MVNKFLQGHKASIEAMNTNDKDISEVLAKSFNVPEISSNGKTYAPAEVMQKALQRNKFDYKITDADMKFYQEVADTNLKLKLIDKPLDMTKVIDRSWIK
jgi:NitT/TauT family transport system substrate-binding protein